MFYLSDSHAHIFLLALMKYLLHFILLWLLVYDILLLDNNCLSHRRYCLTKLSWAFDQLFLGFCFNILFSCNKPWVCLLRSFFFSNDIFIIHRITRARKENVSVGPGFVHVFVQVFVIVFCIVFCIVFSIVFCHEFVVVVGQSFVLFFILGNLTLNNFQLAFESLYVAPYRIDVILTERKDFNLGSSHVPGLAAFVFWV